MDKKEVLIIVAVIVAAILLVSLIFYLHEFDGINEYNNGKCIQCGGTYTYQQTIGRLYFAYYIYICDNCGKMVETGRYMGR